MEVLEKTFCEIFLQKRDKNFAKAVTPFEKVFVWAKVQKVFTSQRINLYPFWLFATASLQ
jgi:hypothetical protein